MSARLSGIDAARGTALLGMMATHALPLWDPATGDPTAAALIFSGRSSALFALLAGVGLALLTGGRNPGGSSPRPRAGIAVRAVIIALVGLTLGGLDVSIAVILFHYAVLFLLALPFVLMPLRRVAAWAAGWVLLSPVAAYLVRPWLGDVVSPPEVPGNITWDAFAHPATLAADVFFTGFYPAVQWLSYLLVGLAIGRLDLRRLNTQLGLLFVGVGAAAGAKLASWWLLGPLGGFAALEGTDSGRRRPLSRMLEVNFSAVDQSGSWWWLATSAPHSGTTLDLVHTSGCAAAVLGACLLLTRRANVLLPLSAAGAMTLTLYSLHVWAMSVLDAQDPLPDPYLVFWAQAAAAVLIGLLFVRLGSRGPLEMVASGASRAASESVPVRR